MRLWMWQMLGLIAIMGCGNTGPHDEPNDAPNPWPLGTTADEASSPETPIENAEAPADDAALPVADATPPSPPDDDTDVNDEPPPTGDE